MFRLLFPDGFEVAFFYFLKAALTGCFCDKVLLSIVFRSLCKTVFWRMGWHAIFSFIWEWRIAAAISCISLAFNLSKRNCSQITSLFLKSWMFCGLVSFTQWPLTNPTWHLCILYADPSALWVKEAQQCLDCITSVISSLCSSDSVRYLSTCLPLTVLLNICESIF